MESKSGREERPATGTPADGQLETGAHEPLGRVGLRHWRQSVITEPGLGERGNVFFAAVEMTRMPMALTDPNQPDNPIVFANNAFYDLTGYEESDVVGRNCRFLQGPQTDREAVRQMREALEARQAIAVEVLNYRRDGSPFWNAVFIGPVFDADGRLIYFFSSQLDVSRRRDAEQALRQSQKMESIGQLTAGLAHDFNNLLQVLTSSLERLEGSRQDPAAHARYLKTAEAATERGVKLTRQLLAFARRSRLEPQALDLSSLIIGFGELLDATVGSRAELRLDLRRRLPRVRVDPVHLEMALLNVVINARDAVGDEGEVVISTRAAHLNGDAAAHHLPPGDYVMLSVRDNGPGMDPLVARRAIEPFFTTKPAGQGTGLGLAMAHGFAQQSGGRLEIVSTPGSGAEVIFYFPVAREAEHDRPRADAPAEPRVFADGGAAASVGDAPPLILVVDDNREIAALAADTLRTAGFEVLVAENAEEALERFEGAERPVALVFSDVVMPGGMNGIVLAREIRRRAPATRILLTTGYNDEMLLEHPRPEDMDVIGKPYRQSELLDRVSAALRPREDARRQPSEFGVARA